MSIDFDRLVIKFDPHDEHIPVADYEKSLKSIRSEYRRFVLAQGYPRDALPELVIKEIRQGCIETELMPLLHLAANAAAPLMADPSLMLNFAKHVWETSQFLLKWNKESGTPSSVSKHEARDVSGIFAPSTNSGGTTTQVSVNVTGNGNIVNIGKFGPLESKKIAENVTNIPSPAEEEEYTTSHQNQALRARVIDFDVHDKDHDMGVINQFAEDKRPLSYATEDIRKRIIGQHDNPSLMTFMVDVDVVHIQEHVIRYVITNIRAEIPDNSLKEQALLD